VNLFNFNDFERVHLTGPSMHVFNIEYVINIVRDIWRHVLKIGKVVDEIAEHLVEKCVRLGIL
jgi:hypothetical protein